MDERFFAQRLSYIVKKIQVSPKIKVLPSGIFPQTLDLGKYRHDTFTVAGCH